MFREMRRKRQQLSKRDSLTALQRGTSGVLALLGDEGYPYTVPISYALVGDQLYFHSAREGHKIDSIRRESKASFCVIDMDCIVPERFTTCYRSVIAFGKLRFVEDEEEKQLAIDALTEKYSMQYKDEAAAEIEQMWSRLCLFTMKIEYLTGKEAKELIK